MSEYKIEWSAILTAIGVLVLFALAIGITLIAPSHIDPSWKQASSPYQVQMYEILDPNVYISTSNPNGWRLQYVYHLKKDRTLQAYQESEMVRLMAIPELEKYITKREDPDVKLTTRLLLLRKPTDLEKAAALQQQLRLESSKPAFQFEILELYDPQLNEAFAVTETDGVVEHWIETGYQILDHLPPYESHKGVIYINNPKEYRIAEVNHLGSSYWLYDENGEPISHLKELQEGRLHFLSRKHLIQMGEDIYRTEGCWYCHTDQTRTLVQDTVLNGSAEYPAPPSSANKYIFQKVTFPGTRRIGPDLSRVGIKRPSRDWHMSHFWSPKTESRGSIMPSFKHFFDNDPAGTIKSPYGVPNYRFEALFQYLMTKGTRITSPEQAWWLGKDPIQTLEIIEGRKQ